MIKLGANGESSYNDVRYFLRYQNARFLISFFHSYILISDHPYFFSRLP
jgi:hypothetical protein